MRRRSESADPISAAAERVVAAVPAVPLADARDFVARATAEFSLLQLADHLSAHPDALTSGLSTAPLAVQALAALLTAAGHGAVRRPACLRCGAQKLLRNRVDGGRVCDRCRYRAHRARCADCGREQPVCARDEQARPLCDSCRRIRRYEPCIECGVKRSVSRRTDTGAPLCRNCDQTQFRTCCRCGQSAPTYANTPGGPTCKGCYQRPRRRCGACGQVRRIDLTATATHPGLCSRCRTRRQRACVICGQLHPAHPRALQPVCLPCRDAGHILEPDLIEVDRTRRRRHETAHDVVRQRLEKILTHLEHGIADQLAPLLNTYQHVRNPGRVMQWLNTPAPGTVLLRELAIRAHSEPITHELLDSYPQTYTLHRLRDLFVHAGILPARAELLERIQPWLDQVLSDRPPHHATLVRPFATWHALRRARQRARRRPTTASSATYVRSQVTIALDFLSWLDTRVQTLTTANQSDLDLWLREGTQTNYFLATFITWANARGLCELTIPHRPRSEPATGLDDQDRWNMLQRCLHDQTMPIDVRAAGTLILLFGRATTTFMDLTVADLQQVRGETYLRLGDFTALLPPPAAAVFHTLSEDATTKEAFQQPDHAGRYLFPGRFPGRPARAHVISRKLRIHGIATLPSRNAARAGWARDIPSPIAADLLGIDISTATQWASRTRRDWTDYIAERAQALERDARECRN
ncbi:MAG TPA: hypothetical protein VIJ23_20240 [Mycobacterium sp.]